LPPSERDFLVFEAVALGGASTRQVAADFGVSQTRVMQIRRHVAEWIARSVPDGLDLTPIQRVRLAAHIADGRVEFLYSQALEAWRESKRPVASACRGSARVSCGDPRYLFVAARICERQLMLAGTARKVITEAVDFKSQVPGSKLSESHVERTSHLPETIGASAGQASGPSEPDGDVVTTADKRAPFPAVPPVGDCSVETATLRVAAVTAGQTIDANDDASSVCDEIETRRRAFLAALQGDTAPVHPPFTDAAGMLLDSAEPVQTPDAVREAVVQLQVHGEREGAAVSVEDAEHESLAAQKRRERRARQRELERLRRRAR
jgi:hypothetical protein